MATTAIDFGCRFGKWRLCVDWTRPDPAGNPDGPQFKRRRKTLAFALHVVGEAAMVTSWLLDELCFRRNRTLMVSASVSLASTRSNCTPLVNTSVDLILFDCNAKYNFDTSNSRFQCSI